jgi:hypothetical protein
LNCQPNVGFNKIVPHTRKIKYNKKQKKINGQIHLLDFGKKGDVNNRRRSTGRLVKSLIKQIKSTAKASQTYEGLKHEGWMGGDSHQFKEHVEAVKQADVRGDRAADYGGNPIIDRKDTHHQSHSAGPAKRANKCVGNTAGQN